MAVYVIANNDYLTDGYVDASFVGTDSDLYVNTGYTQDSVQGEASLTSAVSLSVNGGKLQVGTINVSTSFTLAVDGDVELVGTTIPAGAFTTTVSAIKDTIGSSSLTGTITTSTDADRIADADVGITTSITTTSDADRIANGVVSITDALVTTVLGVATVSPGSDISVSATTVTTATPTLNSGAINIRAIQEEDITWDDSNSIAWDDRSSDIYWGPNLHVGADSFITGSASSSSSFTTTVDGDVTAIADISPAGAFTVDATANFETLGVPNAIESNFTVTSAGLLGADIRNIQIASNFAVASSGIFQVNSQPIAITTAGTLAVDGDVIRSGVVSSQVNATVTSIPSRTRPFVASLTSSFNLAVDATATTEGLVIQAGAFTTTVDADKITDANIGISAAFGEQFKGGILFGGIIDIQGFVTTVSALTIYTIDPFRVYTVDSETRILEIVEETRFYGLNSETRVNSIIEEQRELGVPSETRSLKVQTTKLVEVAGDPLDRREG